MSLGFGLVVLVVACLLYLGWLFWQAPEMDEPQPAHEYGDDDFAWGVAIAMDDDPTPAGRRHG